MSNLLIQMNGFNHICRDCVLYSKLVLRHRHYDVTFSVYRK